MDEQLRRNALDYHRRNPPGKVSVQPTKQLTNQRDLALAYSPGVAAACDEIKRDPSSAVLYTARANLHPLVVEGLQPGGQLTITTMVENWPGHRDGVMGPQLMNDMRAQAEHFGTAFITGLVARVDFSSRPFTLTLDSGEQRLAPRKREADVLGPLHRLLERGDLLGC